MESASGFLNSHENCEGRWMGIVSDELLISPESMDGDRVHSGFQISFASSRKHQIS